MPFSSDDNRYEHLRIVAEEVNPNRRRRQAVPPPPPGRGSRPRFARQLTTRLDRMQEELESRTTPAPGIQPHLVFRVPLAQRASVQSITDALQRAGITIVGIEGDKAVIAFHDDASLLALRRGIADYAAGPRVNRATGEPYVSTTWDVLEFIEAAQMRRWGRADRIGGRLGETIGDDGQAIETPSLYVVDVELWHRGTRSLASNALAELRRFIEHEAAPGERVRDHFAGDTLCLARVSITGAKLSRLLDDLDVVAEVELPPAPLFDARAAMTATPRDFPEPPRPLEDGPRVCTLDSGIVSNHPLLRNNVGHAVATLTASTAPDDRHGHGTMVGGLAVFGDVRAGYEQGHFSSPVTLFSSRVLNENNLFDDEKLIIHQMREAISYFVQPPYNCRVFNVSLGDGKPWLRDNRRQSLWAETLDVLSRELKVLIVVSAGNQNLGWANSTTDSEETLSDYPNYLFHPDCGLCEPATAAIPITVGGLAEHATPAVRQGASAEYLDRPVAGPLEPTPTTRIGPGINDAVKPEFVAPAGNVLFEGMSSLRWTNDENPGLAVMSFSHNPTEGLFAFGTGTSYAAPRVARAAALVWHSVRDYLGEDPDPNLIRALLAVSASVPQPLHDRVHPTHGDDGVRRICGYGLIDEDFAVYSGDCRVTLIAQARIRIDSFILYEVPVPEEFRRALGTKRVVVSLAFDPPVRRRRAEYPGVEMSAALIRGKTREEIIEAYRAVTTEEREAARREDRRPQGAFKSPFRCQLDPGPTSLISSTLQRSEWTFQREAQDYGDPWYLVIRAERNWAPATITEQDFALAVTLEASEPRLYTLLQQRVRLRQEARARARTS